MLVVPHHDTLTFPPVDFALTVLSTGVLLQTSSCTYDVRGKLYPIAGHDGPEETKSYSSTLYLTLAVEGGRWSKLCPDRYIPEKRPGIHSTLRWVGPIGGMNECGKPNPQRDWIRGMSRL